MQDKFMILVCLLITVGCGMLAKSGVPKEQIDADLWKKSWTSKKVHRKNGFSRTTLSVAST